jgi:hypothetical protein
LIEFRCVKKNGTEKVDKINNISVFEEPFINRKIISYEMQAVRPITGAWQIHKK